MPSLARLIALAIACQAAPAFGDLWAYVDAQGRSHVASRQVDARYKLFFKGETTLDAPRSAVAQASDDLAGTRLYARATDPALVQRYATLIETSARVNGLDAALVRAIIAVESAFDPRAVSQKGAIGLMQVLPETGERYGVRDDAHRSLRDKLFDPAINVRVGTRYLRDLLARFDNDLSLALAAYNAGEGAVATHDNGVPPFIETRDYVKRVTQVYALYRPASPATPPRVRIVGKARLPH